MIIKTLSTTLLLSLLMPFTALAGGNPVSIGDIRPPQNEVGEYFYAQPGEDLQTSVIYLSLDKYNDPATQGRYALTALTYTCNVPKGIPLTTLTVNKVVNGPYIKSGTARFMRRGKTIQARVLVRNGAADMEKDASFALVAKVKKNINPQEFECSVTNTTIKNTQTNKIVPVGEYDDGLFFHNVVIED